MFKLSLFDGRRNRRAVVRSRRATFESLESRAMLQGNPFITFTGNVTGNPATLGPPALPALASQTVAEDFVAASAPPAAVGSSTVGGATVGASPVEGSPSGATFSSPSATVFGLQVGSSVNSVDTGVTLGGAGQPIGPATPGNISPNGPTPNNGTTSYSTVTQLIDRLAARSRPASQNSNTSSGAAGSQSSNSAVPIVPPTTNSDY